MALPSGYQRLAWVSCNGKSFLSTRAPANQDTRIEMEVCLDSAASGGTALFGARTAADSLTFAVYLMGDNRLFYGYGNAYKFQPIDSSLERLKVDASKNTVTIEGTNTYTTTLTYVNFQTQYDLILCGCQTPTGYGSGMTGIVLGARRYDGGSLSDDICPCVNADGIAQVMARRNSSPAPLLIRRFIADSEDCYISARTERRGQICVLNLQALCALWQKCRC